MDMNKVKPGLYVKITKLNDTKGMMIAPKHLDARKKGARGIIREFVPGHGGDVWFIKHDDDGQIGAYSFDEFEKVKKFSAKNDKEVIAALRKEVRRLKKKLTEKNKLIKTCQEELMVFRNKA